MSGALITGATSGIGLEIARELGSRGLDLVLVARDAERLAEVGEGLVGEYGVDVELLPADLTSPAGLGAVERRVADDARRPLLWLVNNAGFGVKHSFAHSDVEAEQAMLDLLVTAPMRLTHAALPGMLDRGSGRVLIVSSVAAFLPGGTYSAAKAWATTFSESLHEQYRKQGIHVTALCPGYTHTEFHQRASMDMHGVPGWLWLDAPDVAAAGVRACEQGKALSVPGAIYRGLTGLGDVLPRSLVRRLAGAR